MCKGCWEEAGSPAIINTKTRAVAKLIDDVYSYSGAGGNAHIVVDDWNLEDSRCPPRNPTTLVVGGIGSLTFLSMSL